MELWNVACIRSAHCLPTFYYLRIVIIKQRLLIDIYPPVETEKGKHHHFVENITLKKIWPHLTPKGEKKDGMVHCCQLDYEQEANEKKIMLIYNKS